MRKATNPPATPSATTISVSAVTTIGEIVCAPTSSLAPTDGSSQCCTPPPKISRKPPTSAAAARISIGIVMSFGASCGWTSSSQRFLPRKVITSARVM